MTFKITCSFVVVLMCCAAHADSCAQIIIAKPQYRFQTFVTKDGLPTTFVESISQDRFGFMWFQNYLSLTRFDGYDFKVYRINPNDTLRSLSMGGVGPVFADPKGDLWVTAHTTTSRGYPLAKYDVTTDGFIHYKPNVNGSIVNRLMFDKSDPLIWFTTDGQGLFSFNIETLETKNFVNNHLDSATKKANNSLWGIGDHDTYILVGSKDGLWRFDKRTKIFSRPTCSPADTLDLYHTTIWDINDGISDEYRNVLWLNRKLLIVDENLSVVKRFDFPEGFMDQDQTL